MWCEWLRVSGIGWLYLCSDSITMNGNMRIPCASTLMVDACSKTFLRHCATSIAIILPRTMRIRVKIDQFWELQHRAGRIDRSTRPNRDWSTRPVNSTAVTSTEANLVKPTESDPVNSTGRAAEDRGESERRYSCDSHYDSIVLLYLEPK